MWLGDKKDINNNYNSTECSIVSEPNFHKLNVFPLQSCIEALKTEHTRNIINVQWEKSEDDGVGKVLTAQT